MQIDPVKNTKSVTVFLHQKTGSTSHEAILKVTSKIHKSRYCRLADFEKIGSTFDSYTASQ
jgi:hypothetical protein